MKKAAILTFSRAHNYGALLQTYALLTAINTAGTKAEVLNYLCPAIETQYAAFSLGAKSSPADILWRLLLTPRRLAKHIIFYPFQTNYLKLGHRISKKNLTSLNRKYDVFVTGSDQVWNTEITASDTAFFLDFVEDSSKKNSYAASFGREELDSKEKAFIAPLLCSFNKLYVRETQAEKIVKELTGRDAPVVLDPTLLLDKKQWESVAIRPTSTKYVFMYLLERDPKIIAFAKNLAAEKGLKLIDSRKILIALSPRRFLGHILNAQYIVTNSFHGTILSINFNKEFFTDLLPPPAKVNSRIENIMSLAGLEHRFIQNIKKNGIKNINWNKVNDIINKQRQKSLNYLNQILEANAGEK